MQSVLGQTFSFIVEALAGLYLLVLLLRFWLPIFQADFRNPLAQGVLKITSPIIVPLRRVIPPIGKIDTATILAAYVIQFLAVTISMAFIGATVYMASFTSLASLALVRLVSLAISFFGYAILIRVILSWLPPNPGNPIVSLIITLTEPVLRPFRRWIPPIGGFDISPVFAMIGIFAMNILVSGLLSQLLLGH